MFPVGDDNPTLLTPWVTMGLIAVNLLTWVFVQGLGTDPTLAKSICTLGLVPGELLQTVPAGIQFPIADGLYCVLGDTPQWSTLITTLFMHGGWMHLIGNMWFLWVFGNNIEDSMGHFRFVVFYLLVGLIASLIQMIADPQSAVPIVGASGAIGGVMGAYIMLYPRVNVHMFIFLVIYITTIAVPAIYMLGYWFLVQLAGGIGSLGGQSSGIAFWAHIGGFVAGALLVLIFKDQRLVERHPYYGWKQKNSANDAWRQIN